MILAFPMLIWLFTHYGVEKLRLAPLLCAVAIILLAAFLVFGAYLELQRELQLPERSFQAFDRWGSLMPGGPRFPGWLCLGLVAAGLMLRRGDALGGLDGDPRWALLIGCLLIAAIAVGHFQPHPIPNLYGLLSSVVPGMNSVRRPGELMSGVHLTLCILAGLGAAAILRRTPSPVTRYLGIVLIVATYLATLRPGFLGLDPPVVYKAFEIRPGEGEIAFFRRLGELGNSGPLLEIPVPEWTVQRSSEQVLLTLYHGRRTSSCYASYIPSRTSEVRELSWKLPHAAALARLREMGFTTVVAHRPQLESLQPRLAGRLERLASRSAGPLRRIHATERLVAYEIVTAPPDE
jgi:hypothetical protein